MTHAADTNFALGIVLVVAGGALEGLFSLPVTRTPRWRWENIWGLGSLVALVVVPWPVALLTVPHLGAVFAHVSPGVLASTFLLGVGWGLGGIFWGKGIAAVGMALGISLLMGLLTVFASPVLLAFTEGPARLLEPAGLKLLGAVAVMIFGVAVCGRRRSRASASEAAARDRPARQTGDAVCRRTAVLHRLGRAVGDAQFRVRLRHTH